MQRIRIGLTGLAGVFVLVLLGATLFRLFNNSNSRTPSENIAAASGNTSSESRKPDANEPLAELGVAPSSDGKKAKK